ncbi:hypothetical protein D3C87_1471080 [compost metagenome]
MKKKPTVLKVGQLDEKQKQLNMQILGFIMDIKTRKDAQLAIAEKRQAVPVAALPMIF